MLEVGTAQVQCRAGEELPAAERGGMGASLSRRNHDGVLAGQRNLHSASQLQRQLHLWKREKGRVPPGQRTIPVTTSWSTPGASIKFTATRGNGVKIPIRDVARGPRRSW